MIKVYVAGAMSADNILSVLENISKGVKYGGEFLKQGYAPFVPHLDISFKLQQGEGYDVPLQTYYDYTMEWLKVSDCVFVVPGWEKSIGTINEIKKAEELGIPVFYDVEEMYKEMK